MLTSSLILSEEVNELLSLYDDEDCNDEQIIFRTFQYICKVHDIAGLLLLESRFKEMKQCLDCCERALPNGRIRMKGERFGTASSSSSSPSQRILFLSEGDMRLFLTLQQRTVQLQAQLESAQRSKKENNPPHYLKEQTAETTTPLFTQGKKTLLRYGSFGIAQRINASEARPAPHGVLYAEKTTVPVAPPERGRVTASDIPKWNSYRTTLPPLVTKSNTLSPSSRTYPSPTDEMLVGFTFGDHDSQQVSEKNSPEEPLYLRTANRDLELYSDEEEEREHWLELQRRSTLARRKTLNPLDDLFMARSSHFPKPPQTGNPRTALLRNNSSSLLPTLKNEEQHVRVRRLASQHKLAVQQKKKETFLQNIKNKQWKRAASARADEEHSSVALAAAADEEYQSAAAAPQDSPTEEEEDSEESSMSTSSQLTAATAIEKAQETLQRLTGGRNLRSTTEIPTERTEGVPSTGGTDVSKTLQAVKEDYESEQKKLSAEMEDMRRRSELFRPAVEEASSEGEEEVMEPCMPEVLRVRLANDQSALKTQNRSVPRWKEAEQVGDGDYGGSSEEEELEEASTTSTTTVVVFHPTVEKLARYHIEKQNDEKLRLKGNHSNPLCEGKKTFVEDTPPSLHLPSKVKRFYPTLCERYSHLMGKVVQEVKQTVQERVARKLFQADQNFDATDVAVKREPSTEFEGQPMILPNPFETDLVEDAGVVKTFDSGTFLSSGKEKAIPTVPSLHFLQTYSKGWDTISGEKLQNCLPLLVAAYRIQRLWRGYAARKVFQQRRKQVLEHIIHQEEAINAALVLQRNWASFRARRLLRALSERVSHAVEHRVLSESNPFMETSPEPDASEQGGTNCTHLSLYDIPPGLHVSQAEALRRLQERLAARRIALRYAEHLDRRIQREQGEALKWLRYVTGKNQLTLDDDLKKKRLGFSSLDKYDGDVYEKYRKRMEEKRRTGETYLVPWERVSLRELQETKEKIEAQHQAELAQREREELEKAEQEKFKERQQREAALLLQRVGRAYRYRFWLNQVRLSTDVAVAEVMAPVEQDRPLQYSHQIVTELTVRLGIQPERSTGEVEDVLLPKETHIFILSQLHKRHPLWGDQGAPRGGHKSQLGVVQAFLRARQSVEVCFHQYLDTNARKIQCQWRRYYSLSRTPSHVSKSQNGREEGL